MSMVFGIWYGKHPMPVMFGLMINMTMGMMTAAVGGSIYFLELIQLPLFAAYSAGTSIGCVASLFVCGAMQYKVQTKAPVQK